MLQFLFGVHVALKHRRPVNRKPIIVAMCGIYVVLEVLRNRGKAARRTCVRIETARRPACVHESSAWIIAKLRLQLSISPFPTCSVRASGFHDRLLFSSSTPRCPLPPPPLLHLYSSSSSCLLLPLLEFPLSGANAAAMPLCYIKCQIDRKNRQVDCQIKRHVECQGKKHVRVCVRSSIFNIPKISVFNVSRWSPVLICLEPSLNGLKKQLSWTYLAYSWLLMPAIVSKWCHPVFCPSQKAGIFNIAQFSPPFLCVWLVSDVRYIQYPSLIIHFWYIEYA